VVLFVAAVGMCVCVCVLVDATLWEKSIAHPSGGWQLQFLMFWISFGRAGIVQNWAVRVQDIRWSFTNLSKSGVVIIQRVLSDIFVCQHLQT